MPIPADAATAAPAPLTAATRELREPSVVVGVGGSAGGIEAAAALVAGLPHDFPGAVLVVVHMGPTHRSALAAILARAGRLPADAPAERTPLVAGRIYVASPGVHLEVEPGWVTTSAGPRENGHRPAVDPMFRSLAEAYGARAVGVVLSGARDDGTAGLHCIKLRGGAAFAQDPEESLFDGMPASAARHVALDGVLAVAHIAKRVTALAAAHATTPGKPQEPVTTTVPTASPDAGDAPTRITCPDCGGVLYHHADGAVEQFRCSVGHAYSPDSLTGEHARMVETALWEAARLLDDRAALMASMQGRAERLGQTLTAQRFGSRRTDAERHAEALRALVQWVSADMAVTQTGTQVVG